MGASKLIIPVIILLLAAVIAVVIIILNNKKKNKKEEEEVVVQSTSILPQVPTNEVVQQVVEEKVVENTPLPTIDIPVPVVDDTPITIEEVKPLTNENTSEAIVVDQTTPLVENNIEQDEIVKIEVAKEITNEVDDSVSVEHTKQLLNDVGENITIEEVKPITNDVGQTAFASIPTNNTNINTNIQQENKEYLYNKTEVLNLTEIQEQLKQSNQE